MLHMYTICTPYVHLMYTLCTLESPFYDVALDAVRDFSSLSLSLSLPPPPPPPLIGLDIGALYYKSLLLV
jgi:hypothetical protein